MSDCIPIIDECHYRLKKAGWSLGDIAFRNELGWIWRVSVYNGENSILAEAPDQRRTPIE